MTGTGESHRDAPMAAREFIECAGSSAYRRRPLPAHISDTISKVRAGDLTERVHGTEFCTCTSLTGLRTHYSTCNKWSSARAYCKSVREFARHNQTILEGERTSPGLGLLA